jgi:hypothetical protein
MMASIEQIGQIAMQINPVFALITFLVLLLVFAFNIHYLKKVLKIIPWKTWVILAVIIACSSALRMIVPIHSHFVYTDEVDYMLAGKTLLFSGTQGAFWQSIGWPFILSIVFGLIGISHSIAIDASVIFGIISIIAVFLFAFAVSKSARIAILSCLIFSSFREAIMWFSNSMNMAISILFVALSLWLSMLYFEARRPAMAWLAVLCITFAMQIRPENVMLPLMFMIGALAPKKRKKASLNWLFPFVVMNLLSIPTVFQEAALYSNNTNAGNTAEARVLSEGNFHIVLLNFLAVVFSDAFAPVGLLVCILIGAWYAVCAKKKTAGIVLLWLIVMLFFTEFAFEGSYRFGGGERFFITLYVLCSVLAAYSMPALESVLFRFLRRRQIQTAISIALFLLPFAFFVPQLADVSQYQISDRQVLEINILEKIGADIPATCVILVFSPQTITSAYNYQTISLSQFLKDKELQQEVFSNSSCILFFDDLL